MPWTMETTNAISSKSRSPIKRESEPSVDADRNLDSMTHRIRTAAREALSFQRSTKSRTTRTIRGSARFAPVAPNTLLSRALVHTLPYVTPPPSLSGYDSLTSVQGTHSGICLNDNLDSTLTVLGDYKGDHVRSTVPIIVSKGHMTLDESPIAAPWRRERSRPVVKPRRKQKARHEDDQGDNSSSSSEDLDAALRKRKAVKRMANPDRLYTEWTGKLLCLRAHSAPLLTDIQLQSQVRAASRNCQTISYCRTTIPHTRAWRIGRTFAQLGLVAIYTRLSQTSLVTGL